MELLAPYRLVLVRPHFPGNLGACARILGNFDLKDAVMVAPFCSTQHSEAKRYATNSRSYLEAMKTAARVTDALKDCSASVGFTARTGTLRNPTIELGDIHKLGGKTALVFGNEQDGLTAEELSHCSHVCHINTAEFHKALNLSHAVGVVVARIYDDLTRAHGGDSAVSEVIPMEELESLAADFEKLLAQFEWNENEYPERVIGHMRRIFGRARLTPDESIALRLFLRKSSE